MTTTFRVIFDRISRDHSVPPLDVDLYPDDSRTVGSHPSPQLLADRLAAAIYDYAYPRTVSRGIEVVVDMDKMTGHIFAGMQVAGSFTVEAVS